MEHHYDYRGVPTLSLSRRVVPLFYVYTVQGLILLITNGILAYTIATYRLLRQRYTVQLAQITVDAIMGFAMLIAGIGRLCIAYTNQHELRTRQFCILMPWNILSVWTSQSVTPTFNSILLVIAISTSVASVILYVGVFAVSRKHANRVRKLQNDQQSLSAFEQRQRQLTATMGLSCIFTLVLYVLPVCTKIILDNSTKYEEIESSSGVSSICSQRRVG
ncbi:unnamed protein product [Toxocara canis]|uniref:G_PROTEIN_RECEP_F1_2 domain-containing protein n=1 Tax=Toxocara canis TaxID=6265 RepID=A0A183V6B0_TOXCA|nr:unnamed protein product [Toxocara canis]